MLILFNCKKDMAGSVDFSAANAKSSAQLRVKGDSHNCVARQIKAFLHLKALCPDWAAE